MQEITYQTNVGLADIRRHFANPHLGVVDTSRTPRQFSNLSGLGTVESTPSNPVSQVLDSIFGGAKNAIDAVTGAGAAGKSAEEARRAAEAMALARQSEASATSRLYDALPKVAIGLGVVVVGGIILTAVLKR